MPRLRSIEAIILSQRTLVRELLAEVLRLRCGAQIVARCVAPEEINAYAAKANLLVCDLEGVMSDALQPVLAQVRSRYPSIRIISIDDSTGKFNTDEFVGLTSGSPPPAAGADSALTPLETEVFLGVASGLSSAEIAKRMRRSSKTVEKHRANLMRKLGLRRVAQLTAYALRHGLLNADVILAGRHR